MKAALVPNELVMKPPIAAPAAASGLAVSPDGKELWLSTVRGDQVYVLTLDPLMTSHNSSGSRGLAMIVISPRRFPRDECAIIVPISRSE